MPPKISAALSNLRGTVGAFTLAQKTIAIIGVAVFALGVFAIAAWVTKPAYTPLFSGLSGEDASAIVEQLKASDVSYELSNGGGTVLVPESAVYEQRLAAAAAGLPSSSTGGYSLLDDMGVTTSEFQQSVTYKRALEGELANTIGAMKGVQTASVRLAIPEETVFVSEQKAPTASVFVETQSGVKLGSDQVDAIVHLTSASIEGMSPTDVAVIDADGTVLSAVGTGATGSADKQAADYEERTRGSVQAMLDRIVGPGNATVAIAATVSRESAEVVSETFDVTAEVPALSESTDTETYAGTGGSAAGVLGPDNIAVPGGGNGNGTYSSTATVKNNAVNKVTENRQIPAGAIARQTVSVAINTAAGNVNVGQIEDLVTAAAGIDTERGDEVAVSVVEFNGAASSEAAAALAAQKEAETADRIAELIRIGIIVLGILIPVVLAIVLFLRRGTQTRVAVEVDDAPTIPALERTVPLELMGIAPTPAPTPDPADTRRADLAALAAGDPERTAALLRGMMEER